MLSSPLRPPRGPLAPEGGRGQHDADEDDAERAEEVLRRERGGLGHPAAVTHDVLPVLGREVRVQEVVRDSRLHQPLQIA